MVDTFGPFDSGAGYTATTEAEWRNLFSGQTPGVVRTWDATWDMNRLGVYGDSTGMQVKVQTGRGVIFGHWFKRDAESALAIGAADPTNPRIDLVVLRLDFPANSVSLAVRAGTPAVTPVPPAQVETGTLWEVPLAEVRVNAGVSTITAGSVTDRRVWFGGGNDPAATISRNVAQGIANTTVVAVLFDTLVTPSGAAMWSLADQTKLIARVPGLYVAEAMLFYDINATGVRISQIRANGATIVGYNNGMAVTAAATITGHTVAAPPFPLAAGEYIELTAFQSSGGLLNVAGGTRLGMHRVGSS